MMTCRIALALLLCFAALPVQAGAARPVPEDEAGAGEMAPEAKSGSKGDRLPLPRFVTTRSGSVNVRTGPGERYPLKWVLKKKGVPVEIVAEYDLWRKVRDWEGTVGWVHKAMLTGRRNVVVYPEAAILRDAANPGARPVAELAAGVIADVKSCAAEWCALKVGQLDGYAARRALWGVYPDETIK